MIEERDKSADGIVDFLWLQADISKLEASDELACKFYDKKHTEDIWKALYHTCNMSKQDAQDAIRRVESFNSISGEWIGKQWKKYYFDRNMSMMNAQREIVDDMIDWTRNNDDYR